MRLGEVGRRSGRSIVGCGCGCVRPPVVDQGQGVVWRSRPRSHMGLQCRPLRGNPVPFETVLATLQELGRGLSSVASTAIPTRRTSDRRRPGPAEAQLARHGLAFSRFAQHRGRASARYARYLTVCREFQDQLRFAVDLGSRIRVDTVSRRRCIARPLRRAAHRLVATWDGCIGYAGDQGLDVAWEFEPGFAFNKPSDIQRVLDKLQHDNSACSTIPAARPPPPPSARGRYRRARR